MGDHLGSGQFGDVFKGVWERRHDNLDVAVKTLKEGSSEDDKVKFLQEAAIMAQFKHHNVVTMCGVIKDGEPVSLEFSSKESCVTMFLPTDIVSSGNAKERRPEGLLTLHED